MTAVLVTGGAGYVGSHTCKALALAGYRPVVVDRLAGGHRQAVRWGPLNVADLHDTATITHLLVEEKIEAVLHFAGRIQVGESVARPDLYYADNVAASLSLLTAMGNAGVRTLVFSSSAAVYGLPHTVPVAETHPLAPINPYGETKRVIEEALRWFGGGNYGLRWAALRYFNAAGADPDGEAGEAHDPETHLIPLALDAILRVRPPLTVFGTDYPTPDGTAIRDYIHVSDLAAAHVRAVQVLQAGGGPLVLNLGAGHGYSVREILAAAHMVTGQPVPVRYAPRRAGDPPQLVAAATRAQTVLGWQPVWSALPCLLETAWRWHQRKAVLPPERWWEPRA